MLQIVSDKTTLERGKVYLIDVYNSTFSEKIYHAKIKAKFSHYINNEFNNAIFTEYIHIDDELSSWTKLKKNNYNLYKRLYLNQKEIQINIIESNIYKYVKINKIMVLQVIRQKLQIPYQIKDIDLTFMSNIIKY